MKAKCKTVVIEVETDMSNRELLRYTKMWIGGVDVGECELRSVYVKTDQAPKRRFIKRTKK